MLNNKLISLEKLAQTIKKAKLKKKKIIHCHGVFDLVHLGHIKHFSEAKALGDILVVTITPDKYITKGPNRPVFTAQHRAEFLSELESINYVSINRWPTAIETIKLIKPDVYCKGPDYRLHENDVSREIKNEINAVKSIKGKIKYTNDITFSSSKILNQHSDTLSEKQRLLLNKLPNKSFKDIKNSIERFKKLKVLVIGETIIDQYYFTEALGKSGKEPIMMFRDLNSEQYAGGALAIASHLSQFCSSVSLLSMLGEKGQYEKFISSSLPKNISKKFIYKKSSPTIVKKKYIDSINKNKVFGIYEINDEVIKDKNEKDFHKLLKKLIPKHDLIVLSDYGHGLVSKKSAKFICSKSSFLAINAQVNAANIGHHTIGKYKNVDCVIINENELRHELRNKNEKIENLMKSLCKKIKVKNLIVTQGSNGAILYNKKNNQFCRCPAFASKVVDKVGAGDAMMSLTSIALLQKMDINLSLLIGSLAGAQSVETIGNSLSVSKMKLIKTLEHLLK